MTIKKNVPLTVIIKYDISFSTFLSLPYKYHFPRIAFHHTSDTGVRAIVSFHRCRAQALFGPPTTRDLIGRLIFLGSSATWLDFSYGKFMREGKIHICCAHTNTECCVLRGTEKIWWCFPFPRASIYFVLLCACILYFICIYIYLL